MALLKVPTAEHATKLPPLTDEEVQACETEFGIKFPAALIALLKEQNGGYFENSDFKLDGEDRDVPEVMGISSTAKWGRIQPLSRILNPEWVSEDEMAEIRQVIGEPARILVFGGEGQRFWALDYTRLNHAGEPTVLYFVIEGGDASAETMADSFAELLAGQYAGDAEPAVRMEEADGLRVIASGGYEGVRGGVPQPVRHAWKIYSQGKSIIVLSSDNHGWGIELNRYEMRKDALDLEVGSMADLGEEVEPELAELIQPMIESPLISQFADGLTPPCYQLHLNIDPHAKPDEGWVQVQSSAASGELWKNTFTQIVYATVYSSSRDELEKALAAVARARNR